MQKIYICPIPDLINTFVKNHICHNKYLEKCQN